MRSPPDDEEFRKALGDSLGDVRPLPKSKRAELPRARPVPFPKQTRLDEQAVLAESIGPYSADDVMESGEELLFVRPGVSRQTLRKMRKGHWVVEAQIDLHGLNRQEALALTADFLLKATQRGHRCVRIVHGKGLGVLKGKLRKWLPLKNEVLAFTQAPAAQGGSGALLVLLKS
jgi:DNA-nicking Smr family endonuclease